MTLMERITENLMQAAEKNKENLELRNDALRNFKRDVDNLRSLMASQRTYDKSTVDQLVKLAKMYFKHAQLMGIFRPMRWAAY